MYSLLASVPMRGTNPNTGNEEERLHAALAMAWLGTPAALAILNREIQSKRDPVRRAVETALAAVRKAALARPETRRGAGEGE